MKRVSEVVTIDKVKRWNEGDIISITAGTGTGKSYFIKEILYAHAKKENKKILMLIHRRNCIDQFQNEIEKDRKTDIIDIKSYQSLEVAYKNKIIYDFSEYKYIVCDEFHYFISDAAFNKLTDISLDAILRQHKSIRIFMSATGDYMKQYINNVKNIESIDYELPIKFDFIKELTFFNKDCTIEKFIDEAIEKRIKGIFFIQSAEKAYDLFKKYEAYSLFNCSKSNKRFYKYVDRDAINNMLEFEKFEKLILITTTSLDAGVNLIDSELEHIVCDVIDVGTLIQCIGRKRLIDKQDSIYLYLKTINNQQLGGMKSKNNERIKKAKYLLENTVRDYILEYPRDNDLHNIVYDDVVDSEHEGTKKVNELMYFKSVNDASLIDEMINLGRYGYCKYFALKFGFYDSDNDEFTYRLIDEDVRNDKIEKYLQEIVGERLFKSDQEELIDIVNLKDARGRVQKSLSLLNAYFNENKMSYLLVSKRTRENNNDKKRITYWQLIDEVAN